MKAGQGGTGLRVRMGAGWRSRAVEVASWGAAGASIGAYWETATGGQGQGAAALVGGLTGIYSGMVAQAIDDSPPVEDPRSLISADDSDDEEAELT